jgi:hypothetical protein
MAFVLGGDFSQHGCDIVVSHFVGVGSDVVIHRQDVTVLCKAGFLSRLDIVHIICACLPHRLDDLLVI